MQIHRAYRMIVLLDVGVIRTQAACRNRGTCSRSLPVGQQGKRGQHRHAITQCNIEESFQLCYEVEEKRIWGVYDAFVRNSRPCGDCAVCQFFKRQKQQHSLRGSEQFRFGRRTGQRPGRRWQQASGRSDGNCQQCEFHGGIFSCGGNRKSGK